MRRVRAALIDAYHAQRPLEDFFGGFSLPGSWSAFEMRVDTNLRRYAANYCALGALVSTWTLLRTPRVLLGLASTAAAWLFFAFGRRAPAPRLGGVGVGGGGAAHVGVALAAGLLLTVALGGVRAVAWAAFLSFCTAAVHVALRSRGKGRAGDTVSGAMDSPPPGAAAAAAAGFGSGGAVLRARGAPAPPPTHYATPTFHRVAPVAGAPAAATVAGGTPLPDAATLPRPGGAR